MNSVGQSVIIPCTPRSINVHLRPKLDHGIDGIVVKCVGIRRLSNKHSVGNTKVNSITPQEAYLTQKIYHHLRIFGFSKSNQGEIETYANDKDTIRALHRSQRDERINAKATFLSRRTPQLLRYFASGSEVNPTSIKPVLERISAQTWQADLFRLASLTWSVPVSNGFGRRIRYLVWDACNDKLIGLIAIGDPVFNLSVRDKLIGWNVDERTARLVNIMDAYVLGALPPYNNLLAGKMIACFLRSREVYDEFTSTYGSTVGIISGRKKTARLLAVTTASSMGRSSVYNRLKLNGTPYLKSIGYTQGWGHFHIPDSLFLELREYLRTIGHRYADMHRFGHGPNWRLRTIRAALQALGLKENLLRHGIQREVFLCNLASNAIDILRTGKGRPDLSNLLSIGEVAELALERWIIPRSQRRHEYRSWVREDMLHLLCSRHHEKQFRGIS